MSERIIPLVDQRLQALHARVPDQAIVANGILQDQLGRPMRDLRISVTDRCNFRCNYCMPKEIFDSNYTYLPHKDLLTFEEITRVARISVAHGVKKIRFTGGEPLLRKNLEILIAQIAQLQTPHGQALDLTLTTNGSLLQRKAQALKDAGLHRVTISLDGLDDAVFRQMNDVDFPVGDVLQGIEAVRNAGLGLDAHGMHSGIKINMVVKRSTNVQEILPMAQFFRGRGMVLRFIEYMDVGATNGWCMDEVLPSAEVLKILKSKFQLVPLQPLVEGETAERWGYANDKGEHDPQLGEIGLISSVTQAFCGDCNRARLSTEGKIYLCLFATQGFDLRTLLRSDASDADIASAMGWVWQQRSDRYSQLRGQNLAPATSDGARRVEMSYIGG